MYTGLQIYTQLSHISFTDLIVQIGYNLTNNTQKIIISCYINIE